MATPTSCCTQLPGGHQIPGGKREPSIHDPGEEAPLAALVLLQELKLTSGIHMRPGWEQGPHRGENKFLPQEGQIVKPSAGAHTTSPALLIPEVQGLLQREAIGYSCTVRSKVTVEVVAGRGCSPEPWKPLSAFCPASYSDLIFLFLIHEGELLVWLSWGSGPGPVWASQGWAALL